MVSCEDLRSWIGAEGAKNEVRIASTRLRYARQLWSTVSRLLAAVSGAPQIRLDDWLFNFDQPRLPMNECITTYLANWKSEACKYLWSICSSHLSTYPMLRNCFIRFICAR